MSLPRIWQTKRKLEFCEKYGIPPTPKRIVRLTTAFMEQIDRCKTDEARQLLLGTSK